MPGSPEYTGLKEISSQEQNAIQGRIRGVLTREGLPFNRKVEGLGDNKEEILVRLEQVSPRERWQDRSLPSIEDILHVKEGTDEIITNYITGMVTLGKWVDSDPSHSRSFRLSQLFINDFIERVKKTDRAKKTARAVNTVMYALAHEFLRPLSSPASGELLELLFRTFRDKLPRRVPYDIEAIDVFDSILSRYVIDTFAGLSSSASSDSSSSSSGVLVGYFNFMNGKIHTLEDDGRLQTAARQRKRIITHEAVHQASTSTNGEIDPSLWMGKVGLARFIHMNETTPEY